MPLSLLIASDIINIHQHIAAQHDWKFQYSSNASTFALSVRMYIDGHPERLPGRQIINRLHFIREAQISKAKQFEIVRRTLPPKAESKKP